MNTNRGFGIVGILIVLAIVGVIAGGGVYTVKKVEDAKENEEIEKAVKKAEDIKTVVEKHTVVLEEELLDVVIEQDTMEKKSDIVDDPFDPAQAGGADAGSDDSKESPTISKPDSVSDVSSNTKIKQGTADSEEALYKTELRELEREITVLFNDGDFIGPDHYTNLQKRLNDLLKRGLLYEEFQKLEVMLKTLNPSLRVGEESAVISTSSSSSEPGCKNNANPVFSKDITDLSRISQITPPGTVFDNGDVTSHSYLWIVDGGQVPVYAPADMKLSTGAYYSENGLLGYILWFEVSCEVVIKFDHIEKPIDAIRNAFPSEPKFDTRDVEIEQVVTFKAGELIGYTTGTREANNWDFGVYNTAISPNPVTDGFSNLDDLDKSADCGYDYFAIDLRETYRKLFKLKIISGSSETIPYCSLSGSEESLPETSAISDTPQLLSWILPFRIDESYNPATKSQGEISFAGAWVVTPFSTTSIDMVFEVVPGTILRASLGGRVRVLKNPIGTTPDGQPFDPKDWEIHIAIGEDFWIEYDHVIDVIVSDGDYVIQGQSLARASPASIRHGGIAGEKPVDELEWGLRQSGGEAKSACPFIYLKESEQVKLLSVFDNMGSLGFKSITSACLTEEAGS